MESSAGLRPGRAVAPPPVGVQACYASHRHECLRRAPLAVFAVNVILTAKMIRSYQESFHDISQPSMDLHSQGSSDT